MAKAVKKGMKATKAMKDDVMKATKGMKGAAKPKTTRARAWFKARTQMTAWIAPRKLGWSKVTLFLPAKALKAMK